MCISAGEINFSALPTQTHSPQADPELTLKKPTPQSPLCGHPMTAARIPIRLCHVSGRTRTNRADTGLLR